MVSIPPALMLKFDEQLQIRAIPNALQGAYQKWLRYYLDFCQKYHFPPKQGKSLPPFMQKLQEKRQSKVQQEQAAAAITIYYDILREMGKIGMDYPLSPADPSVSSPAGEIKKMSAGETPAMRTQPETIASSPLNAPVPTSKIKTVSDPSSVQEKTQPGLAGRIDPESFPLGRGTGASWKSEYTRLADEISIRHYSLKTLKTYRGWVQKFQTFTQSKTPALLSTDDVKEFLTSLAVKSKVSSTTQNQAFNSLLFFYRHVLGKEFGKIDGVVRAKRRSYVPHLAWGRG